MRRQLSAAPDLNAPLQQLLDAATAVIAQAWPGPGEPQLLLMGSGAAGDACGVTTADGKIQPFSDLDLALLVGEHPGERFVSRVRSELDRRAAALGLTHNPVDLGIIRADALASMPRTLELLEAAADPVVLTGDAATVRRILGDAPQLPAPFEFLRLVINRITETHVLADQEVSCPETWPAEADWSGAYRWGKLILDLGKADLASEGHLEPRVAQRMQLLRGLGRSQACLAASSAWSAWRAAPHWPPPEVPGEMLGDWIRDLITRIAHKIGADDPQDYRAFTRILAAEGESARLSLHRWRRMIAGRPAGVGLLSAVCFASRWALRARPASLAALAYTLARIDPGGLAPRLVRALPTPKAGAGPPSDAMIRRQLADLVRWTRAVGA